MSVPFDPTKNSDKSLIGKSIIQVQGDNTFVSHPKPSSGCIPRIITKIIHWFRNSNERIATIRESFNKLISKPEGRSATEQSTLYTNLSIFNRQVIQKHNESIWTKLFFWSRVPLIDLNTLAEQIKKTTAQANANVKLETFKTETFDIQSKRLLDCKTTLDTLPSYDEKSEIAAEHKALRDNYQVAAAHFATSYNAEITRLDQLPELDTGDLNRLNALEKLVGNTSPDDDAGKKLQEMLKLRNQQIKAWQDGNQDYENFKFIPKHQKEVLKLRKAYIVAFAPLKQYTSGDLEGYKKAFETLDKQCEEIGNKYKESSVDINALRGFISSAKNLINQYEKINKFVEQWLKHQNDLSNVSTKVLADLKVETEKACGSVKDYSIHNFVMQLAKAVFDLAQKRDAECAKFRAEIKKGSEDLTQCITGFNPITEAAPTIDVKHLDRFFEFAKTLPVDEENNLLRTAANAFRQALEDADKLFSCITKAQSILKRAENKDSIQELEQLEAAFDVATHKDILKGWIEKIKAHIKEKHVQQFQKDSEAISAIHKKVIEEKTLFDENTLDELTVSWQLRKKSLENVQGFVEEKARQDALAKHAAIDQFFTVYKSYKEDFKIYQAAVEAECKAREAAHEICGSIDAGSVVHHAQHAIVGVLGRKHSITQSYLQQDQRLKAVREYAELTQKLAEIKQKGIVGENDPYDQIDKQLGEINAILNKPDKNLLLFKDNTPQLHAKYTQLRSEVETACKTLNEKKKAHDAEIKRLNKALEPFESNAAFNPYFSFRFFKSTDKKMSLFDLVQKHLKHPWNDAKYTERLQKLLDKFPKDMLAQNDLLKMCAQRWYGILGNHHIEATDLDNLISLAEITEGFRWQLNLLRRMLAYKQHPNHLVYLNEANSQVVNLQHQWLLCNAMLRASKSKDFASMLKRIDKSLLPGFQVTLIGLQKDVESLPRIKKEMYEVMLQAIWSKEPKESDLKSKVKLPLLVLNEILLKLVGQTTKTDDPWKLEMIVLNVHLAIDFLRLLSPCIADNKKFCEYIYLLDCVVKDTQAFVSEEHKNKSLRVITHLMWETEKILLEWVKTNDAIPQAEAKIPQLTDVRLKEIILAASQTMLKYETYKDPNLSEDKRNTFHQQFAKQYPLTIEDLSTHQITATDECSRLDHVNSERPVYY